jgi:hypothetical protein
MIKSPTAIPIFFYRCCKCKTMEEPGKSHNEKRGLEEASREKRA